MVRGIKYERVGTFYEMSLFETEFESWQEHLVPAGNSVYDHIEYDSDVEFQFVTEIEQRHDVHLYIKLPRWFNVQTPVGNYNPDWAIVMDDPEKADGKKTLPRARDKGRRRITPD